MFDEVRIITSKQKIFSVRSSPGLPIFKKIAVRSSPDPPKIGFSPDPVRSSPDPCSSLKTVNRPVQVLQNRIVKYMTFSNRTSSASNIFKLLKIIKVSDLHQLNLVKFMYKYNADILPSSFDNFFSKLCNIHDHGTRQVSGNFHRKRVRTDYGKKMPRYVGLF